MIIYIATDDIMLKRDLQKEYFPYIFGQGLNNIQRDSVSGMEEAYTDLLCLANAEVIYGSYWSSFSEMAATIGKRDLIVVK